MLFKKKINRVFDIDKIEKRNKDSEPLELEKGDIPAMIIATFLAFLPAIIIVIAVVLGLYWLFVH